MVHYKEGEKISNPDCRCPNKDKSKCFKIYSIRKKDSSFGKKGEFAGWLIKCPYFDKISKNVVANF